ncbi:hypothetical protein [Kutzneria kofuensis]|uniref:hypothetical protein n=1 Tax=Kutzneria kofuensis TaxID=103725 RepID=UPI0031EAEB39
MGGHGQAGGLPGAGVRRLPRPAQARERFAPIPQARVEEFAGAKHLFVGYTEPVLDAIVATVAPDVEVPLPRVWDGPAEERRVTIV